MFSLSDMVTRELSESTPVSPTEFASLFTTLCAFFERNGYGWVSSTDKTALYYFDPFQIQWNQGDSVHLPGYWLISAETKRHALVTNGTHDFAYPIRNFIENHHPWSQYASRRVDVSHTQSLYEFTIA